MVLENILDEQIFILHFLLVNSNLYLLIKCPIIIYKMIAMLLQFVSLYYRQLIIIGLMMFQFIYFIF